MEFSFFKEYLKNLVACHKDSSIPWVFLIYLLANSAVSGMLAGIKLADERVPVLQIEFPVFKVKSRFGSI